MLTRNEILVTYGEAPFVMAKELMEEAQVAQMIPKGALVGLKPNLVVGRRPIPARPPIRRSLPARSNICAPTGTRIS